MNFFQLLSELLRGESQDYIISMILIAYRKRTNKAISRFSVTNRLNQPIGEYKDFTENFNDTLCDVAGTDMRAVIVEKLKELELV